MRRNLCKITMLTRCWHMLRVNKVNKIRRKDIAKVRGNPKGAKVILDDSRYASRLDVKKTIESAAEDRGVAVDEGSGTRRSHECKPLQVNDFPTGAYGTEYNAGDSKYSDIVRGKSIVRIFHRK